ncbi:MAG: transposase [Solirubrobacterales bacterium]
MAAIIELTDTEWALVEDLFDPPGREGRPARYSRRDMVDAVLFLARTGCQWRYLPDNYPPWEAVWQQWRRCRRRASGRAGRSRTGGGSARAQRVRRHRSDEGWPRRGAGRPWERVRR